MMHNDLMFVSSLVLFIITAKCISSQQTTIYAKRGDTAEICDNRPTSIYAYEYKSFDGKKTSIIEPLKHIRYSNPYQTSLLRILNVSESDSGLYKCPQDDTEWQKLQVYGKFQLSEQERYHIINDVISFMLEKYLYLTYELHHLSIRYLFSFFLLDVQSIQMIYFQ